MKPSTKEWIDIANDDFNVSQHEWAREDPSYRAVCHHAQQCVEKYIKAWLVEQGQEFPKIHNLKALAQGCLSSLPEIEKFMDDLALLTTAAVEVRYPGSSPEVSDAKESVRIMEEFQVLIREKLGLPS